MFQVRSEMFGAHQLWRAVSIIGCFAYTHISNLANVASPTMNTEMRPKGQLVHRVRFDDVQAELTIRRSRSRISQVSILLSINEVSLTESKGVAFPLHSKTHDQATHNCM